MGNESGNLGGNVRTGDDFDEGLAIVGPFAVLEEIDVAVVTDLLGDGGGGFADDGGIGIGRGFAAIADVGFRLAETVETPDGAEGNEGGGLFVSGDAMEQDVSRP